MLKTTGDEAEGPKGLDGISQIECRRISELMTSGELEKQHRHPDKRLYFLIEEGGGRALLDNEELRIQPGTFVVIPANCLYELRLNPDTDGYCFSGTELFLRTRVAQALFTTPASFWESYYKPSTYNDLERASPTRRVQIFSEISAAIRRFGLGCDAAVMGYIFVLLTENTIPNLISGVKPAQKSEFPDIKLVYQYQVLVEKHFAHHFSIEEYCRLLGATRVTLIESCKQASGLTPLELVHKRLILEAKRELLNSTKTVNEIAFDLGFTDSAYFSRFFKKQTGLSPSQFRG